MFTQLNCIALRRTPVSDSRLLLSAWSRQAGYITIAFPAGSGREARRRRALSAPMAMFEGASDIRPGREVVSIRDFMPMPDSVALALPKIERDLIATFLAEFLSAVLRRSSPDIRLSDFLFSNTARLGNPDGIAPDFHLQFLAGLTVPLGIAPDTANAQPGMIFDIREACLRTSMPLHRDVLEGDDAKYFISLVRALHIIHQSDNNHEQPSGIAPDRHMRQRVLQALLNYYSIHLAQLPPLRSLEVLRNLN